MGRSERRQAPVFVARATGQPAEGSQEGKESAYVTKGQRGECIENREDALKTVPLKCLTS